MTNRRRRPKSPSATESARLPRARLYRLLPTERPNPRTRNLDLDSTLAVIRKMNREDRRVARSVEREAARIARAADLLAETFRSGGRAVFVGAGTSGRLGVLEAAECPPTFGTPPSMIRALMAGGRSAVFRSKEGAEDDAEAGAAQAYRKLRPGDAAVGIAASGVTPFVRGALEAARRRGAKTILITSNNRPDAGDIDVVICPRVGPEVLAGSTRLKSGTAAKLVLNMLTTAAMVRQGKVFDRWMVDLKLTSRKLRLRGLRIVCELGRTSPAAARRLLELSRGSVKTAVLAARLRGGSLEARVRRAGQLLRDSGSSLRAALSTIKAAG